jgi:hypothetical protein
MKKKLGKELPADILLLGVRPPKFGLTNSSGSG